jgi:multiple sugar transport system permease protein
MTSAPGSLRLRSVGRMALTYVAAIGLGSFLSLPLVWIVLTALKPTSLVLTNPPTWFFIPTFEHFGVILTSAQFWLDLFNTAVVTIATMVVTLSVGTLAAYGMARHRAGGRPLLYTTLAIRALPPVVLGLPMFVLFTRLGLIDTLSGLTIAYTGFMLPNTIWLMLGFFESVPVSLEEAALIDGCTQFGAFLRIAVPLVRPGLAVTGFYNAIGAWNQFFFGLTLSTSHARPLPVYVSQLLGEYSIKWGEVSAIGTVLLLPPIVLVILMQRQLAGGLTLGGVKG